MATIYRIQDCDGRGPWRPGLSQTWVEDRDDLPMLLPWYVEMGNIHLKARAHETIGTGCRTIIQLRRWFTPTEYLTLLHLGYRCVRLDGVRLLGESETQCVFARRTPLAEGAVECAMYGAPE